MTGSYSCSWTWKNGCYFWQIFTNFLSSMMIHATKPFVESEWIQTKIEGQEVIGTVEVMFYNNYILWLLRLQSSLMGFACTSTCCTCGVSIVHQTLWDSACGLVVTNCYPRWWSWGSAYSQPQVQCECCAQSHTKNSLAYQDTYWDKPPWCQ